MSLSPEQRALVGALDRLKLATAALLTPLLGVDEGYAAACERLARGYPEGGAVQVLLTLPTLIEALGALAALEALAGQGLESHPEELVVNPARRHPVFYGPRRRAAVG